MTKQKQSKTLTVSGRKTKADPTGQSRNRKRATKALWSKLKAALPQTVALFDEIPYTTRNVTKAVNHLHVNELVYIYDISGDELSALSTALHAILDGEFETATNVMPFDWFYKAFVEPPYREATMEQVRDLVQSISKMEKAGTFTPDPFAPGLDPNTFVFTEGYRKNLQTSYVVNYEQVKTLSSNTAEKVFKQIQLGIDAGVNPTTIRRQIVKRFDVAKSDAQRIARTETNAAYNNAKLDTTNLAGEQLDLNLGVMHISALTATTRQTHAQRHGLVYSTQDERSWWNTGANRINCLCTTQTVVLDDDGKIIDEELQEETRAEEKEFFS